MTYIEAAVGNKSEFISVRHPRGLRRGFSIRDTDILDNGLYHRACHSMIGAGFKRTSVARWNQMAAYHLAHCDAYKKSIRIPQN